MFYWVLLVLFVLVVGYVVLNYHDGQVWDFAQICHASPMIVIAPKTVSELISTIQDHPELKISIAGGKFSHGGQTMLDRGLYIDMKNLNRIVSLDQSKLGDETQVLVEAGATWDDLQQYLDPLGWSVMEMQSYRNFSIGGSISINCHGRGTRCGSVGDSIVFLDVVLADGSLVKGVKVDSELGRGVIGGYGGIAIIVRAQLKVVQNIPIRRRVVVSRFSDCESVLDSVIQDEGKTIEFFNGNIYPKRENEMVSVYWIKAGEAVRAGEAVEKVEVTEKTRLRTHWNFYWLQMLGEQLLRRTHTAQYLRAYFEPAIQHGKQMVVWRNYEMSYDTNSLKPLARYPTTTVLQEYFVPLDQVKTFVSKLWSVVKLYSVNLLNVSLRVVPASQIPILNYAPVDRIAVVLYLNMGNNERGLNSAAIWTQIMIDEAIRMGGTYYLPYLPLATVSQFRQCYPRWKEYLNVKHKYDPHGRMSNQFLEKYLIDD